MKYAAWISYAGTRYCGWQKQKGSAALGAPSIQETLEKALLKISREEKVSLVGSGRTDSGVHAAGQVVHFVLNKKEWQPEILVNGLNSLLPRDIRILGVQAVPVEFHAQRSAEKKQYSYYFQQGPCSLPHLEHFSWWIKKSLDLKAIQAGLDYLKGRQDFKSFQASGAKPGPTVREIFEAEVHWEPIGFPMVPGLAPAKSDCELGLVRIRLIGSGFLKQMVRGIAGTLLQIGEGRRDSACMREIIDSRDRKLVGPTAPGRALWLERVWYPDLTW